MVNSGPHRSSIMQRFLAYTMPNTHKVYNDSYLRAHALWNPISPLAQVDLGCLSTVRYNADYFLLP